MKTPKLLIVVLTAVVLGTDDSIAVLIRAMRLLLLEEPQADRPPAPPRARLTLSHVFESAGRRGPRLRPDRRHTNMDESEVGPFP